MNTYTLFSDPHLGTKRSAHTTRESAFRLQRTLYDAAARIVSKSPHAVCLGDLFDKSQNVEATLVQGYAIASRCEFTLAGNHDQTNREGTVTSLDALKEMGCPIVSSPNLDTPYFDARGPLYFVPHHASQELFEKALLQAKEDATENRSGLPAVLFLHCNYDLGEVMLANDSTLNLTEAKAVELLEAFDLILIGHDHQPRRYLDGRVVILGNTHPTSFSDISDKFKYTLEIGESVRLERTRIWSKDAGYAELHFGDKVESLPDSVQFVNVFGMAEADQAVEVADFVRSVWEARPGVFAVRNSVQIAGLIADDTEIEPPKLINLRERIEGDLAGSDLLELFTELAKECSV